MEKCSSYDEIRLKLADKQSAFIYPTLSPEERKQLDVIAFQRDGLQRQLTNAPTTDAGVKSHEAAMKAGYGDLDRQASEANVEIQSLDAQLVAIESYYRSSRTEQKIRPEDIQGPIHDLRAAVDELHSTHDQIREAIVDASREATTAGAAGDAEREMARRLDDLLRQETQVEDAAKMRLSSNDRVQADRIGGLMIRCDSIQGKLNEFDKKVDAQVDVRLVTVRKYLDAEKDELASAGGKLGTIVDTSKGLGGGLAQAMFAKVADKFYDLVVRSDVGIIDVAWGLKDQKTGAVNKLTNQKNAEMKALDEDFRKVLEDDK